MLHFPVSRCTLFLWWLSTFYFLLNPHHPFKKNHLYYLNENLIFTSHFHYHSTVQEGYNPPNEELIEHKFDFDLSFSMSDFSIRFHALIVSHIAISDLSTLQKIDKNGLERLNLHRSSARSLHLNIQRELN